MQESHTDSPIEFCLEHELPELQNFLDKNWKKSHILSKDIKLMNWQHYNSVYNRYNFIISRNNETGSIQGILGYIPTSHFDKNISVNEVFLAIWKVIDNISESMLGIRLIKYLLENENPDLIYTTGLNLSVLPIYKRMGYLTGFLNHFYIVNKKIKKFNLIGNFNNIYEHKNTNQDKRNLEIIDRNELLKHSKSIEKFYKNNFKPKKTFEYIINKYFHNPFYDYLFYSISVQYDLIGIIIIRIAEYNGNRALRMVEFVGFDDSLMNLGIEFQKLLNEYNAEYLDLYNLGLDVKNLSSNGFLLRIPDSKIIVPNYFEPFEKKNVNIPYAINANDVDALSLFKGEGDQDRPNRVIVDKIG
jgi:hypothetical protein